jgi:hypothetical protein
LLGAPAGASCCQVYARLDERVAPCTPSRNCTLAFPIHPCPMNYPCVSPFSFQSTQMAPNRLRNSSRRVVPCGGKTCGCIQNCKRCSLCYSAPAPRDPASFLATAFSFNWLGIKIVTRARAQSSGACFNPHRLQLLPLRRVYMKPNAAPAVRVQQNEPTRLCAHTVCLELPLERPVARCMRDLTSVYSSAVYDCTPSLSLAPSRNCTLAFPIHPCASTSLPAIHLI